MQHDRRGHSCNAIYSYERHTRIIPDADVSVAVCSVLLLLLRLRLGVVDVPLQQPGQELNRDLVRGDVSPVVVRYVISNYINLEAVRPVRCP